MMTGTVVVTDGEQRSALAIVRSLGAEGYRVVVASAHPAPLAGASTFCVRQVRAPDPSSDEHAYAQFIVELCRESSASWLIPVTELSLRVLLPIRDRVEAQVPFPDAATFSAISDKERLLAVAAELGIDVPKQVTVTSSKDLPASREIAFPLVIKPSRSVHLGHKFGVQYALDAAELLATASQMPAAAYPLLLQERIAGPGTGIFLLRCGGKTCAVFAHRRIREKPPSGGVSVVAESIPANPHLVAQSIRLLDAFHWQGVAMVEYKHDTRSGRTVLMEVNGRFWGSLQLAIDAGVDFPKLLLACADGTCPEGPSTYRTGVRTRWWWGDVDSLLLRLRGSTQSLNLPSGTRGRLSAFSAFLLERARNEIFRGSDIGPAVRETINWLRRR